MYFYICPLYPALLQGSAGYLREYTLDKTPFTLSQRPRRNLKCPLNLNVRVFRQQEKWRVPWKNIHRYRENMQTLPRQVLRLGFEPRTFLLWGDSAVLQRHCVYVLQYIAINNLRYSLHYIAVDIYGLGLEPHLLTVNFSWAQLWGDAFCTHSVIDN